MPSRGASRSSTLRTTASGAEAPAVTPTIPCRPSGSSSDPLTRTTRAPGEPAAARATRASATVLDDEAEPMTTTASHRGAMALTAACRLVVAKQRSLRPGVQTSPKRSRAAPSTSSQSSSARVVWARNATGPSRAPSPATSAGRSTRWVAPGATARVPIASSWVAWPA
jgi:hypothetical protein